MITTLLRQALRRLARQPLFSLILVFGFAIGLAAAAIISLYVADEFSFDREHENFKRITRVLTIRPGGTGEMQHVPFAVATLSGAMKDQIPEIETTARVMAFFNWIVTVGDKKEKVPGMVAADPDYFKIFTIPALYGDPVDALSSPDKVVITERMAELFFDRTDVVGEQLTFDGTRTFAVGAVVENPMDRSHIESDIFIPYQVFEGDPEWAWLDSWYTSTITFALLRSGVAPSSLEDRLNPIIEELLPDQGGIAMQLQPLADVHLRSTHVLYDYAPYRGDMKWITLFTIIGVGILLLAVVNFMNLATSRSLLRSREVGLRKVVGASRSSLVRQFLLEAVLLAAFSIPVALVLMEVSLPAVRTLIERPLENLFIAFNLPLLILVVMTLLTGLLAGSYPAFVLSAYRPVITLRGSITRGKGAGRMRRSLVLAQLVASTLLLLTATTIYRQVHYLESLPMGYDVDHRVVLRLSGEVTGGDYTALRDEMISDPGVIDATLVEVVPGVWTAEDNVIPEGWQGDPITIDKNIVDENFVSTMGLTIIEGRDFDPARPSDLKACLINEAAIEAFGWDDWRGRKIRGASGRDFPVLGVVKDYHFQSMHTPIHPQFLIYFPPRGVQMIVDVQPEGVKETLERMKAVWVKHIPDRPYEYTFLDERVGEWYLAEERTGNLLLLFAGLALVISCLGLLGLAAFAAERRLYEIGVRKVFGADRSDSLLLVLKEFIILVLVANVISWLVSLWIGREWAAGFIERAPAAWWVLPASSLVTLVIVLLVTGSIAWKAASSNPIDVLRSE